MSNETPIQLTPSQVNGIKAGLNQVAQGCVTLVKVLSMAGIPESDKFPNGRIDDPRQSSQVAESAREEE